MSAIKEGDFKLNSCFPKKCAVLTERPLFASKLGGASVMFPFLDRNSIYPGSPQNVHLLEIKSKFFQTNLQCSSMNLFWGVKSSVFEETIKRSLLKGLQVLQTVNVGVVRGEGWCSLSCRSVQARQL